MVEQYLPYVIYGLIVAGVFYLISKITSKVEVKSFITAIIIAVVFTAFKLALYHFNLHALLDKHVGVFLREILSSLPNSNLIVAYVILLIINIILVWLSDLVIGGFRVKGFLWVFLLAVIMIVLDIILTTYGMQPLLK